MSLALYNLLRVSEPELDLWGQKSLCCVELSCGVYNVWEHLGPYHLEVSSTTLTLQL